MLSRLLGFLQEVIIVESFEPGEFDVAQALRRLDNQSYKVIHNLVLPSDGNTSYSQIDHVVISPYGIFCIETKSHHGIIFGSRNRKYWTQCSYTDRYKVYNPLWQNYGHIKSLEIVLAGNLLKKPIISYVVFPFVYKLNVDNGAVFDSTDGLIDAIKGNDVSYYSPEEVDHVYQFLKFANIKDLDIIANHKKQVAALTLAN